MVRVGESGVGGRKVGMDGGLVGKSCWWGGDLPNTSGQRNGGF